MTTHLEQELEGIKSKIFEMADYAMESIVKSVDALKQGDSRQSERIIQEDTVLDNLEVELDDECIKVLVTRQPAAGDLRFVLAMLKINTDLERIGDLSTNIAKETIRLNGQQLVKPLVDIPRMGEIAVTMLKDAFRSITDKNVDLAREVIARDEQVDELNIQVYRELFSFMAENPRNMSQCLGLIMVSKALERIGDHITNIAERAIYYIEGIDVRHSE